MYWKKSEYVPTADVIPLFGKQSPSSKIAELFLRAARLDAHPETVELAENLYREVIRMMPDHVEALVNLGVLAHRRGAPAEALEAWAKVLLIDPRRAVAHNNIGQLLQSEEKYEVAAVYLARAVRYAPEMSEARVNFALVLQALGKFRTARKHWRQYLQREPRGEFSMMARKNIRLCSEALA